MLTGYLLVRFIIQNCTLLLSGTASTLSRPKPVPTLLATALILTAAVILTSSTPATAPAPNFGQILTDNGGCYYEAASVAHINQSPCSVKPNEWAYVNVTNSAASAKILDAAIDTTNLKIIDFQQLQNVTRYSHEAVNLTTTTHDNGTTETRNNITAIPQNFSEWVTISPAQFTYSAKEWKKSKGKNLRSKETLQFRVKLTPKNYGGAIKYSILANDTTNLAELDPTLNGTAYNITSNSDLNLTAGNAQFVDGKLILAVPSENRNFTTWDTWADNELENNPDWNCANRTTGADQSGNFRQTIANGIVNLSIDDLATSSKNWCSLNKNTSVSTTDGITISTYIRTNTTGAFTVNVCFFTDTPPSNTSSAGENGNYCFVSGTSAVGFYIGSASGIFSLYEATTGGGFTEGTFGSPTFTDMFHLDYRINSTHHQACVNETEGAGVCSALRSIPSTVKMSSGGFPAVMVFDNTGTSVVKTIFFTNFTIVNNSKSGLSPYNLTNATLQSVVMNDSLSVTSVKVSNQTLRFGNSKAGFNVFDAKHQNKQSLTEGTFTSLSPSITGFGINGSFQNGSFYTATEVTSILVEFTQQPEIVYMDVNGTNTTDFQKGKVVNFFANFTTTTGTTLTNVTLRHNITADGALTNVTIPASGTNFNASINLTILLGNTTRFGLQWFANTTTYVNNSIPNFTITTLNTKPETPTISAPTSNSNRSSNAITITAAGDLDNNTITYRYYINNSLNVSSTATSITFAATPEKNYVLNVSAFDGTDDSGNSSLVSFQFDNLTARISNGSNDVNLSGFYRRNHIGVNWTFTELFNSTILIRNGSRGTVTNTSPSINTTYFRFNFTALDDANYTFTPWINDTAGNANTSLENVSITIDTTLVNITLQRPADLGGDNLSRNYITLNISLANETYNQNLTVTLWNNATINHINLTLYNTSDTGNLINLTGLAEGRYNITVSANDTAGNTNQSANHTFLIDTTTPIIENGTLSTTSLTAGNPFTITVNFSEANPSNATVTIGGSNFSMSRVSGRDQWEYTYTTAAGTATTYTITRFYLNDTASNNAMNVTSLSVTTTVPGTASGGGGGGGGIITITTNGTTITVLTNASFTAKPSAINSYANYYTTAGKAVTKKWLITATAFIKACNIPKPFECNINPANKLEAELKLTYTQTGFSQVFKSQAILISESDTAAVIPIRVQSLNLGISLPITIPRPEAISALYAPAFFDNQPEGSRPRALLLATLAILPSITGSYGLIRKGRGRRAKQR